jgi:two-component system, OmpR family, response regulator
VRVVAVRIYLVEDNAIIRENLVATLAELADTTMCGYAEGENDAVSWLSTHHASWDLAIVDLFLKQGNGLGVVAAGKIRHAKQKLVVLTNYATPEIRQQCLTLGADAVFDKSQDIDDLVRFCNTQKTVTQ